MEEFKDIQDIIKKKDSVTKVGFLVFAILIPVWIISSRENIMLFHFFIECFIVLICASLTVIIVNTKEISDNDWFKVLGLIFAIISIFEFLHTTLYKGMTMLPVNAVNQSIQFGLCENYIGSLSMLIFLNSSYKKYKTQYIFCGYTIISIIMLLGILVGKIFPVCYVEGEGFTTFKLINEYIILIIYALNIITFELKKNRIKKDNRLYIGMSVLFAFIAHIFFAFNIDLYNITNIFAHIFKLIYVYLIYRIILKNTLNRPLHILNMKLLYGYKALISVNERLKNQNFELETAKKELTKSKENLRCVIDNLPIAIILRKEETIVFANSKAVSFFSAKSEDEIVGKNVLEIVHPEYINLVKKEIENSKQGMLLIDSEEKVIDLYGNSIDVEVSAFSIIEDNQNLVMVIFRDVTERKRSELMEKN